MKQVRSGRCSSSTSSSMCVRSQSLDVLTAPRSDEMLYSRWISRGQRKPVRRGVERTTIVFPGMMLTLHPNQYSLRFNILDEVTSNP